MKISLVPAFLLSILAQTVITAATGCENQQLYLPYKIDGDETCDKYNLCTSKNGSPTQIQCPTGLLYNDNTKSCTWKSLVNCNGEGKCLTETGKVPVPNVDVPNNCVSYKTCVNWQPTGAATDCTNDEIFSPVERRCLPKDLGYCDEIKGPSCRDPIYNTEKYLAVLNDCSAYYQCKDGVRIKGKCPNGMHIDTVLQRCAYPSSSKCKDSSGSLPSVRDICKGKASKFVADPLFCKGYYYCIDESTPYWRECGDKKYFDKEFCTQARPATCSCEDLTFTGNEEIIKPHANESKYYVCAKDEAPVEMTCPNGFIFSLAEESCVPK